MTRLAEAGAALLGGCLIGERALQGGDLSSLVHIVLKDGREAVIKTGTAPRTEAGMLRAIADAGAPAPRVLAVDDAVLALEFVGSDGAVGSAWADLGSVLATLHRTVGPRYGWSENYAFGPVAIDNGWSDAWPAFYADRRLMTHVAHIPAEIGRRVERLANGLGGRLPERPEAALLHGDLWGGNVLATRGKIAAFIDPACIFGHAEIDIAMLHLFDSPSPAFREAYGTPCPGQEARRPIYLLWPALVHLRLFGESYRGMVVRLLAACGV